MKIDIGRNSFILIMRDPAWSAFEAIVSVAKATPILCFVLKGDLKKSFPKALYAFPHNVYEESHS